jgi:hypothetical protein
MILIQPQERGIRHLAKNFSEGVGSERTEI